MNNNHTEQRHRPQISQMSRRQFLKITAVAGSLVGLGALGMEALKADARLHRVHKTHLLLGTVANITLITDRPGEAEAAINASFETMTALEAVMSRFKPDSQLSRLNAAGELTGPHPALIEVLTRAAYYSDLTGGAFDVTVEPVLALYREHALRGGVPSADAVAQQRALVNYRDLVVSAEALRFQQPGMAITLDGIAKGYVIDKGADKLRWHGFDQVLVELGGDMQAHGSAGERPWQVRLQAPRHEMAEQRMPVVRIENCALATSGDYMQSFTPDFHLHHILNPGTGDSPSELSSASVIAPTACDADALATASMVLGPAKAVSLLDALPDAAGAFVDKAGQWHQTANFPV